MSIRRSTIDENSTTIQLSGGGNYFCSTHLFSQVLKPIMCQLDFALISSKIGNLPKGRNSRNLL